MFTALLLFGGALNLLVRWIAPLFSDQAFLRLMEIVEKIILYSDIALVVWWVVFSTYRAIKEMYDE